MTTLTPAPAWLATPEYTWRPASRADAPRLHALMTAVNQADGREQTQGLTDIEHEFDDPWMDAARDSLVVETADGALAAMALTYLDPESAHGAEPPYVYLWGEVHPAHRRRGLGRAVLEWMQARGQARLAAAGRPGRLRVSAQDNLADRLALFAAHDFQPLRYFFRMRRDLAQPIPDAPLPAGLTLRPYTPADSEALRLAFNDTFADHWDFHPVSVDDWNNLFLTRSGFRPDLTLLACPPDGEIAGYSINRVSEEENRLSGEREGWIGTLGVRRAWRKRGLASALICQSMRLFRAEGLEFAKLGVDAENLTGALRLYENLGFVRARRFVLLDKPAAP